MAGLRLGCSRADITPPVGCSFSGHLNRNRPAESVLDPLYVRVLSLSDGPRRVLIVNLDLLELGPPQAARLERAIRDGAMPGPDAILLTATHTHTGPPVIDLAGVPVDEAYFVRLEEAVARACGEAVGAERRVTARAGSVDAPLGVNRRRIADGRVRMAPNPTGPVDPCLTVVSFDGADGRPRGLLLNYAVHPTTLAVDLFKLSADYPGRLGRILLEELGPDFEYAFLQGASGDVKPALYDEAGEFKEGGEADIEALGRRLADAALSALRAARPLDVIEIEAAEEPFAFAYQGLPTAAELSHEALLHEERAAAASPRGHLDPAAAARYLAGWARRTKERLERGQLGAEVESRLRFLRIGGDVALVGVPGELFAETGLAIRQASPFATTLVAGYTGGSLGYFPTARALRDGGYEASEAYKYYDHPAPFRAGTCDALVSRCSAALDRLKRSAAQRLREH